LYRFVARFQDECPGLILYFYTCLWQIFKPNFFTFLQKKFIPPPPPPFDSQSYILAYYLHFPEFLIKHNFVYGVMQIYEGGPHVFFCYIF